MRALLLVVGLAASLPSLATELTWSVENGFPLFRGTEAFKKIKAAWSPGMSAAQFLASQDATSLRALLPKTSETLWNPATGLYEKAALFRRKHTIIPVVSGVPLGAQCTWFVDGKQYGKSAPCEDEIKIDLPESVKMKLTVVPSEGDEGKTDVFIRTRTILAFGDSFASGEGNPDRAAVGTDASTQGLEKGSEILSSRNMAGWRFSSGADWWDTTCHRSLLSWQSLYAMKIAASDPHMVVRFASFSCSGAEAYDGFFRAQINPPADDISNRVRIWDSRDGGNYLELTPRVAGQPREEAELDKKALNKSQLNAALHLLCPETPHRGGTVKYRNEVTALGSRKYYGVVKVDACSKALQPVDEVLMAFGGNDVGFAGVVTWGLVPKSIYRSDWSDSSNVLLKVAGESNDAAKQRWLSILRGVLNVINPKDGARASQENMSNLYSDIGQTLDKNLGISSSKVKVMLYPNPLQSPLPKLCGKRLDMGNVAMTERVVKQSGFSRAFHARAKYFMFLIDPEDARYIENSFIAPLRADQQRAINALQWGTIDSQPAFAGRSLCSVSPECETLGNCSVDDRFAWTSTPPLASPSMTPLGSFAEWNAHSSTRARSLRTGNDAFMTQVRFNPKNRAILPDWFNGSVHPTSSVHAAIADLIEYPKPE
ncbi:hypothetical protein [Pseudomonas sp. Pseusp97]|uniref:hypothetical protein n=1 Tax=Pseudomonas sp. Pseusp97 TaxID=3243065 RepID=UPI0039A6D767